MVAGTVGVKNVYNRPELMEATGRELERASAPVRSLTLEFDVYQSPIGRTCYVCGEPGHGFLQCPRILAIRDNPPASRRLATFLGATVPSSRAPTGSRLQGRSNAEASVHQLETDTDRDPSAEDVPEDEANADATPSSGAASGTDLADPSAGTDFP